MDNKITGGSGVDKPGLMQKLQAHNLKILESKNKKYNVNNSLQGM